VVIAGNVMVMVALVLAAVLAALWRPGRLGAALLAGAIVPMAAQAISAIVQLAGNSAYNLVGIPQAQAQAAGITVSSGFTAAFWLFGAFVLVTIALCARMVAMSRPRAGVAHSPLAARPLAFPGSGPHTFRADGPYAFTTAGAQTAGSDGTVPAGEPASTTAERQRTTPPDGLPAHPGGDGSSG
jgi:hypothetical protein